MAEDSARQEDPQVVEAERLKRERADVLTNARNAVHSLAEVVRNSGGRKVTEQGAEGEVFGPPIKKAREALAAAKQAGHDVVELEAEFNSAVE